jgi:hypothetical protein
MMRRARTTEASRLAADAYLSHALHKYGGPKRFAQLALQDYDDPLKQLSKWRHHAIGKNNTSAIETCAPGTEWVRWHPLFSLLEPKLLSRRAIRDCLACYEFKGDCDCFECNLPEDDVSRQRFERALEYSFDEFLSFVARGDLHGYALVVAVFRLAGLARNDGVELFAAANLVYGLPLLERLPWLRPHRQRLRELVVDVLKLRTWHGPGFEIDWDAIERLSDNSDWQYWLEAVTERAGANNPVVFFSACPERPIVSHAKVEPRLLPASSPRAQDVGDRAAHQ